MIARLQGTVLFRSADHAVLDVHGVGYRVFASIHTLAALAVGQSAALRTFTHVREDALLLYGFIDEEEQRAFEALIGVNGIGPKLALSVLSGIRTSELALAIASSDAARLQRIPGVGKKTA